MTASGRAPALRRGYASCRFGQLHYLQGGPPETDAAPLVLLHQTPSSTVEFLPFARLMAADRPVIAFDTPGFGMSDPPPSPLSMADYAAAFAEALDELDLVGSTKLDLLGYHTGAYVAAELAIARPDLIGRVILCGLPFRTEQERTAKLTTSSPPPFAEPDAFAFVKAQWDFAVVDRPEASPLARALQLFAERIRAMERASWPYQGVWRFDAEQQLARIDQPVLVLQPHDPMFPHWRIAAARLLRATIMEFPHLTKDVFDCGAEDFARAVRDWTARTLTGKAV